MRLGAAYLRADREVWLAAYFLVRPLSFERFVSLQLLQNATLNLMHLSFEFRVTPTICAKVFRRE